MIRPSVFMFTILFATLVFATFHIEERVQSLRAELKQLNNKITENAAANHVLKAEWTYLNRPERLEYMTKTYLNSQYIEQQQFADIDSLPVEELAIISQRKDKTDTSGVKLSRR